MALYKLTAPRKFGNLPKGYEFQIPFATTPTLNVENAIQRLGFNKQAQSFKRPENFNVEKIS